jgi:hypothetical protein
LFDFEAAAGFVVAATGLVVFGFVAGIVGLLDCYCFFIYSSIALGS